DPRLEDVGEDGWRILVASDLAALDEDLLVEGEADRLPGERLDGFGRVPRLDGRDARRLAGRREDEPIAAGDAPRLDAPREDAPRIEFVDVLDRKTQRQLALARRAGEVVERLDDGRRLAPRHPRRLRRDIVAVAGGDRDHRLRGDADRGEIGCHFTGDGIEAV